MPRLQSFFLDLGEGAEITERRTSEDWAARIKRLAGEDFPRAEKTVLVRGNLKTHTAASLYKTFPVEEAKGLRGKLETSYTPKQGSRLNMAEIELIVQNSHGLSRRIPSIEWMREEAAWNEMPLWGEARTKKIFEPDTAEDARIVHHALEHLGMENMAKRNYKHLSGGEKQCALIARAIAQESDFLILDEPANHLDVSYQLKIFDFVKRRSAEAGVTVLSAIHDLNMAALYCDRLYVMKEGRVVLS